MKPPPEPSTLTHARLIERALAGEGDARETLVLLCRPGMGRAVQEVLTSRRAEEFADVLHEALIKLLESLPGLRNPDALLSFARQLARHVAFQYLERHRIERMMPVDPSDPAFLLQQVQDEEPCLDQQLDRHALLQRLRTRLFPLLNEREALVYQRRFLEQQDIAAIARELGVQRNLVDWYLNRIRVLAEELVGHIHDS